MKVLLLTTLLLLACISSIQSNLIVVGDTDTDFNVFGRDFVLHQLTEFYPDRTNNLKFTKISQNRNDQGFGAGITDTGDLYFWGSKDGDVKLSQKLTEKKVTAVSSSGSHILFVSNGIAYCYADNLNQQCGNFLDCRTTECAFGSQPFASNAIAVEAGDRFSYVIFENGEIYAAGNNQNGYLGVGSTQNPLTSPTQVLGDVVGKSIRRLKTGRSHTIAQDADGNIYTWGRNANGEMGDGTFNTALVSKLFTTPVFNEKVIDFECPESLSVLITESSKIYAMGFRRHMIFGPDGYAQDQNVPVFVLQNNFISNAVKVSSVDENFDFVSFVTSTGEVFYVGQTGIEDVNVARKLPLGTKVVETAANLIALDENGKIFGFNYNQKGRVNYPFLNDKFTKAPFDTLESLPELLSDGMVERSFVGLHKDGVVYAGGSADSGQLGIPVNGLNRSFQISYPYTPVASNDNFENKGVTQIAVSSKHLVMLKNNELYATGLYSGTQTNPTFQVGKVAAGAMANKNIRDIYASTYTTVIVTEDNLVYYFGHDIFNGDSPSTSLEPTLLDTSASIGSSQIKTVACGHKYCVFLADDNKMFGSGENFDGQLGVGDKVNRYTSIAAVDTTNFVTNIVDIKAGLTHTLFLDSNGIVFGAGKNDASRKLGFISASFTDYPTPRQMINTTSNIHYPIVASVVARKIYAGGDISLILTVDNKLMVFGKYQFEYLSDPNTISSVPVNVVPFFANIPSLEPTEIIRDVAIRPRTMFFFTEYSCFGRGSSEPDVCSGKGKCIASDVCQCVAGYAGNNCQHPVCNGKPASDPTVCSGNGQCTAPDSCTCKPGFTGNQCQSPICFGKPSTDPTVCSGKGQCSAPDSCTCQQGYGGNECQFPTCFGKPSSDPTVCSGNGQCAGPDTCTCKPGFRGAQCQLTICFGKDTSDPTVCSGNGQCSAPDNCQCKPGYVGGQCQSAVCFGKPSSDPTVCSGKGQCSAPDTCNCQSGYSGNQCQNFACFGKPSSDPTVCSGNGQCSGPDSCTCKPGFAGNQCQSPICFGKPSTDPTVCSGNGQCSSPDSCTCKPGFTGNQCQSPICFGKPSTDPTVCTGNGQCSAPDTCTCKPGYGGNQCQLPVCFGKPSSDPTVCTGNGQCTAPNTCTCNGGYRGDKCQFPVCYGKPSSDPTVCNGNGQCTSPDKCQCKPGYLGAQCNIKVCFGKNSTDPAVCSGKGQCTAPNNCVCSAGYGGNQCQFPVCFGKPSSDPNVCSGKGQCTSPNVCKCRAGFTGNQCQAPVCFGKPSTDPKVCSGRGKCTAPDTCNCNQGFSGKQCETQNREPNLSCMLCCLKRRLGCRNFLVLYRKCRTNANCYKTNAAAAWNQCAPGCIKSSCHMNCFEKLLPRAQFRLFFLRCRFDVSCWARCNRGIFNRCESQCRGSTFNVSVSQSSYLNSPEFEQEVVLKEE